jgi:uncharacterized protein GlcG (DUF336 family)
MSKRNECREKAVSALAVIHQKVARFSKLCFRNWRVLPILLGFAGLTFCVSDAARAQASTEEKPALTASASASPALLTPTEVGYIIGRVVQEATARHKPATIAVVDRVGAVLAVYRMTDAPMNLKVEDNPNGPNVLLNGFFPVPTAAEAIAKAVTGAYLSSSHGNAFSTRTASQIVQDHFNPGTHGAPSGPLFGVQFSQLPCSDLMVRATDSLTRGPHRSPLGLAGDPGGFPLYKNGQLVGGIGVKAEGSYRVDENIYDNDHSTDEILALAGTFGFRAPAGIRADTITAGGLTLRYSDAQQSDLITNPAKAISSSKIPATRGSLVSVAGYYDKTAGLRSGSAYGSRASGLVRDFSGSISKKVPPYLLVDDKGHVRFPAAGGIGAGAMTKAEVLQILRAAYASAIKTRAQIRNPPGSTAAITISVVDTHGIILAIATIPDAPIFGIDVSLQKARSAVFMSSAFGDKGLQAAGLGRYSTATTTFFGKKAFSGGFAWSARAIGNIARDSYPDGIDTTPNGPLSLPKSLATPFSDGLQLDLILGNLAAHVTYVRGKGAETARFCTTLPRPPGTLPKDKNPVLANGLQIFPGGFPIYRNGQLVGGIGISGDGVDQDDMTGFLGIYNAGQQLKTGIGEAPFAIRASVLYGNGASPHYVNCPYAPYVGSNSQNLCGGK